MLSLSIIIASSSFPLEFAVRVLSPLCLLLRLSLVRAISSLTKGRRMTWRDGGARVVSDIFVTIARRRVPDYPAPRGELFLRRDSTQATLSRLSCPGEENIKLVPAAYS